MENYYYSSEYLSHHGILGQKWGRRNGPPYPLNPSDHSAAEKKATRYQYNDGSLTGSGKRRLRRAENKMKRNSRLEQKASKYEHKAARARVKSDKHEVKSYGLYRRGYHKRKSMDYRMKSNKLLSKAATYRYKVTKNKKYMEYTKKKLSTIPSSHVDAGKQYIHTILN